jgi:hypothetical protein
MPESTGKASRPLSCRNIANDCLKYDQPREIRPVIEKEGPLRQITITFLSQNQRLFSKIYSFLQNNSN